MLTALILSGLPVLIFTSVGRTARRLPLLQALPDDGFWLAIAVWMALGGAGAMLTENFALGLPGVQVAVILFAVAAFCVIVPALGSYIGQSHPAHKLFNGFLDGCCLLAIVPAILGVWNLTEYLLSLIGWPVLS